MLLPVILVIHNTVDIISKLRAYHYIGLDAAYKNSISVQGEGKVYAKPDIAIVNLSVVTEGTNLKDVQDKNSRKMNGVVDFLKGFGIEEKDIKTINYQIYPRYNYENRAVPTIIGYEINQTLEVKIRNLEKIGEILDKSVSAGINQVSSLRFWVDKDDELKEGARKLAIEDAKKKAETLADNLGIKLVKIIGFTEDTGYYPMPTYKEAAGMGGGEMPNIQTGENEITVNVSIIYEID
ncbi:MAG: hypothetical protein COU82_00560 [Candidatus Portnoybacteria bacterium CG10_big_fil_rev_8_21_14_0_10_38_18]|uniref:SIMPL domain-containing protein n=1 Tax=Candidatus Portnoybacteria bacterium CG10_big_fil_rev_8_21_14_0_10_38_18 TaxID=1974813 RepID=A0A2M8KCR4_9BACT|nr:MAG: hypothetical protein COU82_00560 [Candidatus Portnoybacteria bacterium CG10_big_fil_rev_8_21_14_0_10_38_18]